MNTAAAVGERYARTRVSLTFAVAVVHVSSDKANRASNKPARAPRQVFALSVFDASLSWFYVVGIQFNKIARVIAYDLIAYHGVSESKLSIRTVLVCIEFCVVIVWQ